MQRTEANGAGEAVDGFSLREVGFTADLEGVTATFRSSTAANRLRYYLTATGHGLRPWVGLQITGTGARAVPVGRVTNYGNMGTGCACFPLCLLVACEIVVYATQFTNVNSHL